jgi:hypothetical protein
MTVHAMTPEHPVLACAGEMSAALDRVAGVDPAYMTTPAKATALTELSRVVARAQGLLLRVLANADDVALDQGARSVEAWLAHETRADVGPMLAAGRLADALETRWRRLGDALGQGLVNDAQASVIARALDELPDDLDPELVAKAETHLLAEAAHFDPKRLRVLGRRILEVVAPGVAEEHERRLLAAEEARARRTTSLTMRRRGDGTTDVHLRISDAVAGRLRTYLEAYAAPRRGHLDSGLDSGADRTDPETGRPIARSMLMGQAFCALLESMPSERLPRHGGSATTVLVTINFDTLRSQLGAAGLDTGEAISAGEAMRLACNASIVPAVLGGKGQPLHLGRARRLFSSAQRLAMGLRDGGCRARGCTIPATWCEAHHAGVPWADGGRTDIDDGVLLCSWHHHRAHDPGYRTDTLPNGDIRFRRRP